MQSRFTCEALEPIVTSRTLDIKLWVRRLHFDGCIVEFERLCEILIHERRVCLVENRFGTLDFRHGDRSSHSLCKRWRGDVSLVFGSEHTDHRGEEEVKHACCDK